MQICSRCVNSENICTKVCVSDGTIKTRDISKINWSSNIFLLLLSSTVMKTQEMSCSVSDANVSLNEAGHFVLSDRWDFLKGKLLLLGFSSVGRKQLSAQRYFLTSNSLFVSSSWTSFTFTHPDGLITAGHTAALH